MAGFLYYKPGARQLNQVTLAEVKAWGLGHAFDTNPQSIDVEARGLDGARGFVFADEKRLGGMTVGLYPDEQQWEKVDGCDDGLWIGFYKEHKPTAADLKRATILGGYIIALESGEWVVPLVRSFDTQEGHHKSELPCYLKRGTNGRVAKGRVLEAYAWLWKLTESYAASLFDTEAAEQDEVDAFAVACQVLSANYAISDMEASVLELFSDLCLPTTVLLAAVDYGTFAKWLGDQEKKSAVSTPAGSTTSAGDTD